MMSEDGGVVSTIFVAGLPYDAQTRELENMLRFLPGYEGVKIAGKGCGKGGAAFFAKFTTVEGAMAAVQVLNGNPFDTQYADVVMRAELARSDMKTGGPPRPAQAPVVMANPYGIPGLPAGYGQLPVAYQTAAIPGWPAGFQMPSLQALQAMQPVGVPAAAAYGAAAHGAPAAYGADAMAGVPSAKRPRVEEAPNQIDTLAIFGATEKGFTEGQLEEYFKQIDGYITFKSNSRVGGGFVKFASHLHATAALEVCKQTGLEAQMSRSSMFIVEGGTQANPFAAAALAGGAVRPAGQPIDTLILQGVMEKGWTPESITELFQSAPGFVSFKVNPRVGGGFVKFDDVFNATDAIKVAAEAGIEAQFARSSMN